MAPVGLAGMGFTQRKLRSSSLATPPKKIIETDICPNTIDGKKRSSRSRAKVASKDALRGVVTASPTKAAVSPSKTLPTSPGKDKKRAKAKVALFETSPKKESLASPLRAISLNSPAKSSPRKSAVFRPDLSRLAEARKVLSSAVPDVMVGRERQMRAMRAFLEDNLAGKGRKGKKSKRSIYVSGPPGTGKTTCLKRLLGEMEPLDNGARVVFVNCMSLGRSGGIFCKVADALCPTKMYSSTAEAQRLLEHEVVESERAILLVLDEVDQLDSKSQEVLYTLFEWPYLRDSKLVLVGIANALDLTDRILPRLKLRDAVCPAELAFPAYSRSEIVGILRSRLGPFVENVDKPLFQPKALEFLAGKISALSGDTRKALDVCRRAVELAEVEARKQTLLKPTGGSSDFVLRPIDVPQILRIVNEIYCSSVTSALRKGCNDDLPLQQKLLIASLLLMSSRKKMAEVTMGKLHETYAKVCRKRNMAHSDLSEASSMCGLLESRGFLSIKSGGPWASSAKDRKIRLRIDDAEVEAALKDKALLSGILNDVECVAK